MELLQQTNSIYEPNFYKFSQQLEKSTNSTEYTKQIIQQLQIFSKVLIKSPILWFDALANDEIMSDSQNISINQQTTMTKIYRNILIKVDEQLIQHQEKLTNKQLDRIVINIDGFNDGNVGMLLQRDGNILVGIEKKLQNIPGDQDQKQGYFEHKYIDESSKMLIAQILDNYANIIVSTFNKGKEVIIRQTNKIDQHVKKCSIMNTYLLFGILKQMNRKTQNIIYQNIKLCYVGYPEYKLKQFCKYIQKNYQYVTLSTNCKDKIKILDKEQFNQYVTRQNQIWLNHVKNWENDQNVKFKKIKMGNQQLGILVIKKIITVQTKEEMEAKIYRQKQQQLAFDQKQKLQDKPQQGESQSQSQQLQLQVDEYPYILLRITQENQIIAIDVKICQKAWKVIKTRAKIDQMYESMKKQIEENSNKDKDYYSYGVPTVQSATIGGSLGRCLADINKYSSANQFLKDLSRTAAIFSCFSLALQEIPILGYFIVAGGFTYSFYMTFRNKATSSNKKMHQVGGATVTAIGSIGSIVGGIFLGQVIIPVPILGAFVGGVVGGFCGTKGVRKINWFVEKKEFNGIVLYLKNNVVLEKCWEYNDEILEVIGVDKKYFDEQTRSKLFNKNTYLTAICFCIVTLYYKSQKNIERSEQKQKQSTENQIQSVEKQQKFANEFNIVKIVDYLSYQNLILLDQLQKLENLVSHIVS